MELSPTLLARVIAKIRPVIERDIPNEGTCLKNEEECFALHPIHPGGWVDGRLVSVVADLDGFLQAVVKAMWEEHLIYLSTGCLHGEHGHCCNNVNIEGEPKWPGHCKFCTSSCLCPCHPTQPIPTMSDAEPAAPAVGAHAVDAT